MLKFTYRIFKTLKKASSHHVIFKIRVRYVMKGSVSNSTNQRVMQHRLDVAQKLAQERSMNTSTECVRAIEMTQT